MPGKHPVEISVLDCFIIGWVYVDSQSHVDPSHNFVLYTKPYSEESQDPAVIKELWKPPQVPSDDDSKSFHNQWIITLWYKTEKQAIYDMKMLSKRGAPIIAPAPYSSYWYIVMQPFWGTTSFTSTLLESLLIKSKNENIKSNVSTFLHSFSRKS